MANFIDPRTTPVPNRSKPGPRVTPNLDDLAELHRLCRDGKIYHVERWIQAGRPLQIAERSRRNGRRPDTALGIAMERDNHALVYVLLVNGVDPNLEEDCPLSVAMEGRQWEFVDLLLEWGANPHRIDLGSLFGTYDSKRMQQFHDLGVDLAADHEIAKALAYHTSNKPAFGFARRHRAHDPRIQRELDMALAYHAREGGIKGVSLCLWAGADPHVPAVDIRYSGSCEDEHDMGWSAIHEACHGGDVSILKRLGPDPSQDEFDELYRAARTSTVIQYLAEIMPPQESGKTIQHHLWWVTTGFTDRWGALDALRALFEVGARWASGSTEEIASARRLLLKAPEESFVDVMKLFAQADYCSSSVRIELARTPAMRKRMKAVGFFPQSQDDAKHHYRVRPTRSREVLTKFGVELPKMKKPVRPMPRVVTIGPRRSGAVSLRLSRQELFERVWSTPIVTIAEDWGLSGRGLAKACARLRVPVPPRGYWAKREAGKRVRRPRLPTLKEGEAEEIVVWQVR
jgi:hypothetical protein